MLYGISDKEFQNLRRLIYELAGISLSDAKKALVVSRLSKRLRHHNLTNFGEYYELVQERDAEERRLMVDLITTNETYFFREPKHFEYLSEYVSTRVDNHRKFRVWSAASSSGEEPYSIGMTLAEKLGNSPWEVVGTDISSRVLQVARAGLYPISAAEKIPRHLLNRYCLKGIRSQEGQLLVSQEIRNRVRFEQLNLHDTWPDIGMFDVVFLRNVMIYFDIATKQRLLSRIWLHMNPGGILFIGHSETLNRINGELTVIRPSIYRKQ